MGLSLALTVVSLGIVTVKEINLYVVKFEVDKPEIIVYLLLAAWLYYLLLHVQFHRVRAIELKRELLTFYFPAMARAVGNKLFRRYVEIERQRIRESSDENEFNHKFRLRKVKVLEHYANYWAVELNISVSFEFGGGGLGGGGPIGLRKELSGWQELLFPKLIAWLEVVFLTPYPLQYWLPYIIAAVPVFSFVSNWL